MSGTSSGRFWNGRENARRRELVVGSTRLGEQLDAASAEFDGMPYLDGAPMQPRHPRIEIKFSPTIRARMSLTLAS